MEAESVAISNAHGELVKDSARRSLNPNQIQTSRRFAACTMLRAHLHSRLPFERSNVPLSISRGTRLVVSAAFSGDDVDETESPVMMNVSQKQCSV